MTCDEQIGRLSDALKSLDEAELTSPHAATLSLVSSYQVKSLARQINDYKGKLPAPDMEHPEHALHVRHSTTMNRGEFVHLEKASLHQAAVVCEHFRHRVDALMFEVSHSQQLFAGQQAVLPPKTD